MGGDWFDDARMGQPRGVTAQGDDRLTWCAKLFAQTGYAVWHADVCEDPMNPEWKPSGLEILGSSATDARRTLRKQWNQPDAPPWPGHNRIRLRYVECEG